MNNFNSFNIGLVNKHGKYCHVQKLIQVGYLTLARCKEQCKALSMGSYSNESSSVPS